MTSQAEVVGLRTAKALSYVCGHRDELAAILDEDDDALRAVEAAVGSPAADYVSLTAWTPCTQRFDALATRRGCMDKRAAV
ncbi:hypothetical protein VT50_0212635 [Streptomyces antioxidans]|uniref:Uncharacterized protein n=1 Tax=Streptomyces antioxidans TaxID=1507734 RepID=A0A1V4D6R8_9ACTN|nr:hypothetical protein [Streptomyces antioxidans]OPF80504.1 hypothetical protein VT50_0212635 [Streptomyces antioxidans]